MPRFEIVQSHVVTTEEARRRLQRLSRHLMERYGLTATWTSSTEATVERSGARGTLRIEPDRVRVDIDLPFVFAPLRERIEGRLRRELGYLFADEAAYNEAAFVEAYGE